VEYYISEITKFGENGPQRFIVKIVKELNDVSLNVK